MPHNKSYKSLPWWSLFLIINVFILATLHSQTLHKYKTYVLDTQVIKQEINLYFIITIYTVAIISIVPRTYTTKFLRASVRFADNTATLARCISLSFSIDLLSANCLVRWSSISTSAWIIFFASLCRLRISFTVTFFGLIPISSLILF